MYQTMHSWAQRCCLIPTTGPSSQPPWTTPCGSTALSAAMSGCCTSVRAHGQVSMLFTSYLLYVICSVCHSTANRPFLLQELSDLSPEPVRSKFCFVFRVSYKPERFGYASQERRVNWLSIYPATDAFTVVCYTLLVLKQLNLI